MFGIILSQCKSGSNESANEAIVSEFSEGAILIEDLDGNEINLEDYKGKTVVINFWATWCKPCISEMPSFDRLIQKTEGDEVVFFAASDENIDRIKKFIVNNPHSFKYVHLKTNMYSLGLSVLPTTYIIDKEGKIAEKMIGAKEWDSEESIKILNGI